jgi:ABC-type multidrug transport system ATPase subunit
MAPSGMGKTTLFRLLLGLETADQGNIQAASAGAVFQENRLIESLSPIENVRLALPPLPKADTRAELFSILSSLLPAESLMRPVSTLSGGMKRRCALARALLSPSEILILDEATTGLDPVVRDEILDIFLEFIQDEEHSILFSTHITSDIQKVADYVILIHNGKIIFEEKKDDLIYNYGIIRCKKSEFNTVSPDDYVCCRETNLSVECLIHDKVAAKKRYQNLIIDNASIEDIMLFYIKGGVK